MRLFAALLAVVVLVFGSAPVRAESIADFFALVPGEAFGKWNEDMTKLTAEARRSLTQESEAARTEAAEKLKVRDLVYLPKSGFLSFSSAGDGEGLKVQVTYWRMKKGGRCLVAAAVNYWSAATDTTSDIHFYEWNPEAPTSLQDVTATHLPKVGIGDFFKTTAALARQTEDGGWKWRWLLPQKGTTIRIIAPEISDDALFEKLGQPQNEVRLEWNGAKFTTKKVPAAPVE